MNLELLQPFLLSIYQIRKDIFKIHQTIEQITEEIFLIECETYEELQQKPNINEIILKTNQLTISINKKIKQIESEYKDNNNQILQNQQIERIIQNHITCITNSFFKNMKEYQTIQLTMKKTIEKSFYQKLISFNPALEELIEENEIDQIHPQFMKLVCEKEDNYLIEYFTKRHDDIVSLKESIEEVYHLFISFDILLKNQQDIINSIEYHCNEIKEYIIDSNIHIDNTLLLKKKYYKVCFLFYFISF